MNFFFKTGEYIISIFVWRYFKSLTWSKLILRPSWTFNYLHNLHWQRKEQKLTAYTHENSMNSTILSPTFIYTNRQHTLKNMGYIISMFSLRIDGSYFCCLCVSCLGHITLLCSLLQFCQFKIKSTRSTILFILNVLAFNMNIILNWFKC